MPKNWEHAAGLLWPLLTDAAKAGSLLEYGDVAPVIGTNPLSVRYALDPIQSHCIRMGLLPLTAIVVNSNTKVPGKGFIAWAIDDIANVHKAVFAENWAAHENPYQGFLESDTDESLARRVLESPEGAGEVYAVIKTRGAAQRIFRHALILAYGRCAMCGLTFQDALDAAHLKPWAACSPSERMDPRNGLVLCATHHRLFDLGYITLDDELRVVYSDPEAIDGDYSQSDRECTSMLHHSPAHFGSAELRPQPEMLKKHRQINWKVIGAI